MKLQYYKFRMKMTLRNLASKKVPFLLAGVITLFLFITHTVSFTLQPLPGKSGQKLKAQSPAFSQNARLFFSPSTVSLRGTGVKTVDLVLDTGGAQIGQMDIRLGYDPKILGNLTVKTENFTITPHATPYRIIMGKIDHKNGVITYSIVVLPEDPRYKRPRIIKLATITFNLTKALSSGTTLFTFLPKNGVYAASDIKFTAEGTTSNISFTQPKSILRQVQPLILVNPPKP